MSGTGHNNFQAPDRLTPPDGDQPIGTDGQGKPVKMTMYMFQMLQRLLAYLGQPAAGTKAGQTISQQVGVLNQEMGLALSGPGSAVPGLEGRLALVEATLRRISEQLAPAASASSAFQVPRPVLQAPSPFVIPGPPVQWNAGFADVIGTGLTLTVDGTLSAIGRSSSTTWDYQANTAITVGPPPSGDIYWNNATQTAATIVGLSHLTFDNVDVDLFIDRIGVNDIVFIQDKNDSTNFQEWKCTSAITIHPNSYVEVPVTLVSSGGTGATNFPNNHLLFVALFQAATGLTAGNGISIVSDTISAVIDNNFTFNAGTIALANVAATTLFGNSSTASAEPHGTIAVGTGLALSVAGTLAVDTSTIATVVFSEAHDNQLSAAAATTAALPANTYNNGTAGVGATLTGNVNGALPAQDGITLAVGNLLLVKNEGTTANNGLFVLSQLGDGSHPYILTRWQNFNSFATINAPMLAIQVRGGTVNANTSWVLQNPVAVVGTNAITFILFGPWQAANVTTLGAGLSNSGGTLSASGGTGVTRLTTNIVSVGNGADTTEDILQTYTLTAGQLASTGQAIRITASGQWLTNATNATRTVKLYFGSTVVAQLSTNTANLNTPSATWRVQSEVIRLTGTTQIASSFGEVSRLFNGVISSTAETNPAETLSGTVLIKVTGQSAAAFANFVTSDMLMVEFLP